MHARPAGPYRLALLFPLQVSEDTFLQACECALNHLQADFHDVASSVRATCRGGRMLYDRHLKKLGPNLWGQRSIPPEELRQSLLNFSRRGAKPPCLQLEYLITEMYHDADLSRSLWPPNVREEQL